MVACTRKEQLLDAIANGTTVDFVPVTREELFLAKIAGMDVETPTPVLRIELLYQSIIDSVTPLIVPVTRLEKIVAAVAGLEVQLFIPATREECWWIAILEGSEEIHTVTASIVCFIAKKTSAIKSLIANISYTQDLHGYANPWLPGGGKNKFNGTFLQGYWAYANGTWVNSPNWITTEKIPCKASTSYTVSADAKMTRWQGFVWYDSNGDFISTDNLNSNVNIGLTKTSPSNAAYLIFNIAGYPNSTDTIAPSDVTHFQLEEGSSSTSYAPYSNICPISGFTGVNVTRTGKNLFDGTFIANTMIVDSTGEYYTNEYHKCSNKILAKENTVYTLSGTDLHKRTGTATNAANVTIAYYKADGTYIRREAPDTSTNTYKTVTTPANTAFVIFQVGGQATNVMLEESATETTYEPFGTTYPISWQTEAGTVYGGTLDIVTGELTVTSAKITPVISDYQSINSYGIVNWRIRTPNCTNYDGKHGSNALRQQTSTIASTKNEGFYISSSTYSYIRLLSSRATTSAEANQVIADNGVYIVYELAEPDTYQLTPTEVTALLGDNTIWADTGDVTVTYEGTPTTIALASMTPLSVPRLSLESTDEMTADTDIEVDTPTVEPDLSTSFSDSFDDDDY